MHANTQIPKVIGFKRIADLDGEKAWSDASDFFWHTVVNNQVYLSEEIASENISIKQMTFRV